MGARGAQDDYVDTVDEIVSGLRQDPVLVQDVMGNGHTAEVDAALSTLVEGAAFPVYVSLTVVPRDLHVDEPSTELLHLLHGRLGPGVYVVATADHAGHPELGVYVDVEPEVEHDETLVSLVRHDAVRQVEEALARVDDDLGLSAAGHAAMLVEVLDKPLTDRSDQPLTAEELSTYTSEVWTDVQPAYGDLDTEAPSVGLGAVIAVGVGTTVAVVGYRLLQARSAARTRTDRHRQQSRGQLPDAEVLRDDVGVRIGRLSQRLSSPPGRLSPTGLDARERARECLEAAEALVDSPAALDLVAALVLVRTGERALRSPERPAYRCCFLNPLHGEGTDRAHLGGREELPVCRPCARALDRGRPVEPLLERRRLGRSQPYYEGDTRWADTGFGALDPDRFRRTARRRT